MDNALEAIGWRQFHNQLMLACACGYVLDNGWMQTLSMALPQIQKEWDLSDFDMSVAPSVLFGAMGVGAVVWGSLADRYGRRMSYTATVAVAAIGGVLLALAPSFAVFCVALVVVGFGVGGNLGVDGTTLLECTPPSRRGAALTLLSTAWSLGTLLVALLAWGIIPSNSCADALPSVNGSSVDACGGGGGTGSTGSSGSSGRGGRGGSGGESPAPAPPCAAEDNYGWRMVAGTVTAVSLLSWAVRFCIPETPAFLLHSKGQPDEAKRILHLMIRRRGLCSCAGTTAPKATRTVGGSGRDRGRRPHPNALPSLPPSRDPVLLWLDGVSLLVDEEGSRSGGGAAAAADADADADAADAAAAAAAAADAADADAFKVDDVALSADHGGGSKSRGSVAAAKISLSSARRAASELKAALAGLLQTAAARRLLALLLVIWMGTAYAFTSFNMFLPKLLCAKGVPAGNAVYRDAAVYAVAGVPGSLVGACLVSTAGVGRRGTLFVATTLTACALAAFWAVSTELWVVVASCVVSACSQGMFAAIYTYTPESMPVPVRGLGVGLCSCGGRAASLLAPLASGALFMASAGSPDAVLIVSVVLLAIPAAAVVGLPPVDSVNAASRFSSSSSASSSSS